MTSNPVYLLRKGLTSEYFLASFLEKDPSRYRLTQVVQNKTGRPDTSKSYDVIEKLTDSHYLVEKNEKHYPNLEKLVDTIDSNPLRDWQESFDPDEKETLVGMLQNREFFKVVSGEILADIHNQPYRIHTIDALEIIANKIGLLTVAILLYKTYALDTLQESSDVKFTENLKQINEEQKDFGIVWNKQVIPMLKEVAFERKLTKKTKEVQKQLMKIYKGQKKKNQTLEKNSVSKPPNIMMVSDAIMIFLKSMPSLRPFLFVPEKTLWKLCKLWEGYGMFEFVMKFNQAFESQNKKLS